MIFSEKMQEIATNMGFTFRDYVDTLEEERKKVLMFQRELPLCLELVTQAIDYCKKELSGTKTTTMEFFHGRQLECSEQTSSEELRPVLEEFIPMKKNGSSSNLEQEEAEQSHKSNSEETNLCQSDWLRSAQLWNQVSDPPLNQDFSEKTCVVEVKKNGGAFQPFQREKTVKKNDNDQSPGGGTSSSSTAIAATSSTAETASAGSGESSKRDEKEDKNQRKQRRCWSPELHRRFLHALQQLGGSHVATPKQIREMMKVDGLTNDEVKSHLQKYRLHTRRPSSTIHNNDASQPPQFLVVGGIWVPASEYAAIATSASSVETVGTTPTNGIYAPVSIVAAPPPQASASKIHRPKPSVAAQCNSPATSSSTHTSTISPAPS